MPRLLAQAYIYPTHHPTEAYPEFFSLGADYIVRESRNVSMKKKYAPPK